MRPPKTLHLSTSPRKRDSKKYFTSRQIVGIHCCRAFGITIDCSVVTFFSFGEHAALLSTTLRGLRHRNQLYAENTKSLLSALSPVSPIFPSESLYCFERAFEVSINWLSSDQCLSPAKSLNSFELNFARPHRHLKAPYANLVYTYTHVYIYIYI